MISIIGETRIEKGGLKFEKKSANAIAGADHAENDSGSMHQDREEGRYREGERCEGRVDVKGKEKRLHDNRGNY